mmetsp:Transcript_60389/g.194457  ORF Transcript_60389/g.194457 Transcript_60389/m.194457 type:complete len:231 (-) Transcript_60389:8-700(-)
MILLRRAASLLVLGVPKRAAHGEVAIDPRHTHDLLDSAAGPLYARPLARLVWLVVRRQPTVCARALHHAAVGAAEEDAAVAQVRDAQAVLLAAGDRPDQDEGAGGATRLLQLQELAVQAQGQGRHGLVILWGPPCQLLLHALRDEGRALVAAVAVKHAEEAPCVLHEDHVHVLHGDAPAIHLGNTDAEQRPTAALHHHRRDGLRQALAHCGLRMSTHTQVLQACPALEGP